MKMEYVSEISRFKALKMRPCEDLLPSGFSGLFWRTIILNVALV